MKILHVADLHLSTDATAHGYGLDVLAEVLRLSAAFEVDALLITGHLLDDAGALDEKARELLQGCPCPILAVCAPGEPTQHLAELLEPMRLLTATPFESALLGDGDTQVEIIGMAPRPSHADFHTWEPDEKTARWRLLAAHADLLGLPRVDTNDELRPVLDPDIFAVLDIDHAALGGSHDAPVPTASCNTSVHVAGSAVVTEAHENSQREAVLIHFGEAITTDRIPISVAGRFQHQEVWLDVDAQLTDEVDRDAFDPNDHVELQLHGTVGNMSAVEKTATALRRRIGGRVRRLDIVTHDVVLVTNAADETLARRFDALWRQHRRPDAPDTWNRARRVALAAILQEVA